MAKSRKKSALQKNRDRLSRQIREAERRGYRFEAAFKEKIKTASVQQLSHWRGDYIYRYGERDFVNEKTGEIETVRGLEARRRERLEASKRGGQERWRKQRPEPGVAEPEQEPQTPEDEERRRDEEEQQRQEEEERRAKEARANVTINNIIDLLHQPNNPHRSAEVSELADECCWMLENELTRQKEGGFDSKMSLANRIRANLDILEDKIDRIKWDSGQDVVTSAFNRVLEIISNIARININDDFFQALEDSMW